MPENIRRGLIAFGVCAAVCVRLFAAVEAQSSRPIGPAKAVVIGRVIDATTGQPIAGAFVTIAGSSLPARQPTMVADDRGRFVFRDLPPGKFELSAAARGYLAGDGHAESGPRPVAQAIELGEGEQATNVTIRLFKPSRISGTIVDDIGDPIEGAQVGVLRVEYIAGYRRLQPAGGAASDDRGDFRSGPLVPGSYVIGLIVQRTTVPVSTRELIDRLIAGSVPGQPDIERSVTGSGFFQTITSNGYRIGDAILQVGLGGASVGPAPTADGKLLAAPSWFYPGVSSAALATPIVVRAGEDRAGINLQVRLAPAVRVSGRIVGPDGPVSSLGVTLVPDGSDALVSDYPFEQGVTLTNAAGAFTFLGVPGGLYTVKAYWLPPAPRPGPAGAPPPTVDGVTLSGILPVSVGETDVTDLVVTLQRGPSIRGRIVFDGSSPRPSGGQMSGGVIRFELADGRAPRSPPMPPLRTVIEPDGQFRSVGLPAGRYVIRADGYAGWTLESAIAGDRDVSDEGFAANGGAPDVADVVVTMTDTPASVSGVATTANGVPAPDATVLLFSRNRADWVDRGASPRRLLRAKTSQSGGFSFTGLPAGEYLAFTSASVPPENWPTPEFLGAIAATSTRFTVERRSNQTLNLTVAPLPRGGGQ